ncbi:MAG: TetR family transcriptional regulator [Streptosporangiales bacterium]|nr:TetR family transcriptional regulator [Streptosporangiales bacterium]
MARARAEPPRKRRPRKSLSAEQVVDAAITLIQRDGIDALSMPRLAAELDCGVMTLYGYVQNREDLLSQVTSRVISDLPVDRSGHPSWDEALRRYCVALRQRMLEYPTLVQLLIKRRLWSPDMADMVEWLLTRLTSGGWSTEGAVRAYRAAQIYTLGFAEYEVERTRTHPYAEHETWWRHTLADLPPEQYPQLHAAAEYLPQGALESQYSWGLDQLIDGLGRERRRNTKGTKGSR